MWPSPHFCARNGSQVSLQPQAPTIQPPTTVRTPASNGCLGLNTAKHGSASSSHSPGPPPSAFAHLSHWNQIASTPHVPRPISFTATTQVPATLGSDPDSDRCLRGPPRLPSPPTGSISVYDVLDHLTLRIRLFHWFWNVLSCYLFKQCLCQNTSFLSLETQIALFSLPWL